MKASNILAIILGVIVIIGGVYCMLTPTSTYLALAWVLGFAMIVDGIANIVTWFQLRSSGHANGWALFGAIISVVLGVIVLGSTAAQLAIDLFIAYMAAAWFIVSGITRIMFGWRMRALNKQFQLQSVGRRWWAPFILGILLVAFGCLSLFNPVVLMMGIGVFIGLSIVVMGISVVTLAV